MVPCSSKVSSEGSVIETRSLSAPSCLPWPVVPKPSEVPLWTRTHIACLQLGLLCCACVVLISSKVPFEDTSRRHTLCSHVVPEFSEGPSVNSDPKRLPASWTALLMCGFRILERSFRGHVIPTHSVSCLPPRSVLHVALLDFSWGLPAGSLLDRACFLDEGFARVCGLFCPDAAHRLRTTAALAVSCKRRLPGTAP